LERRARRGQTAFSFSARTWLLREEKRGRERGRERRKEVSQLQKGGEKKGSRNVFLFGEAVRGKKGEGGGEEREKKGKKETFVALNCAARPIGKGRKKTNL